MAIKVNPKFVDIGKASAARESSTDLILLVKQVKHRPTHVRELFLTSIDYGVYGDACVTGISGVFFPLDSHAQYTVFRPQLPTDIQKRFHIRAVSAALLLAMMMIAPQAQDNICLERQHTHNGMGVENGHKTIKDSWSYH
jgi:hypothetical protein